MRKEAKAESVEPWDIAGRVQTAINAGRAPDRQDLRQLCKLVRLAYCDRLQIGRQYLAPDGSAWTVAAMDSDCTVYYLQNELGERAVTPQQLRQDYMRIM